MERVSAIEYADRYALEDGAWGIRSCHVRSLRTPAKALPEGAEIVETLS
jgi:hypothetical protein